MTANNIRLNRREWIMTGASIAMTASITTDSADASDIGTNGMACPAARTFPPPTSISEAAQTFLRQGASQKPPTAPPAPDDAAGWHAYAAEGDKSLPVDMILGTPGVALETRQIGGATCHIAIPNGISAADRRKAHLYIHGGGWVLFGGRAALAFAKIPAMQFGGVTYAVDYRMPPDHPFPAGLDDCCAVYAALLQSHAASNILVSGSSAGGNLAAALMLKARDTGLARPAALVLDTPVTDLTNSGDSWSVLYGLDPVLRDPEGVGSTKLYLNGRNPRDPYLSPLFGENLAEAFPPTHLRAGTRDRLLSDTVRMHAALRIAGVPADLYVSEAMPHGGFGGYSPEDAAAIRVTRKWLGMHWPAT